MLLDVRECSRDGRFRNLRDVGNLFAFFKNAFHIIENFAKRLFSNDILMLIRNVFYSSFNNKVVSAIFIHGL